jgi:V-type H+-transporting ATPase subunit H
MIAANLLQFVKSLSTRKWTDPEITEDLDYLQQELQTSFDQLTYLSHISNLHRTFDEYSSEIESGYLSWTPPHRSEEFWRENAPKLLDENSKILKILTRLLATSKNPVVLAVACHDVGQLVKQVPQARS